MKLLRSRWINYAACVWAIAFGAPHLWWALGISAGFPGGPASYRFFMSSSWRYAFDVVVVLLSAVAIFVAVALLRPRSWLPRIAAWIACIMLTFRGIGGMAVDGASDPIWWPLFLTGGLLFGSVACFARTLPLPATPSPRIPKAAVRGEGH